MTPIRYSRQLPGKVFFALVLLYIAGCLPAQATNYYYISNTTNTDWSNTANWTPSYPGTDIKAGDTVIITDGGNCTTAAGTSIIIHGAIYIQGSLDAGGSFTNQGYFNNSAYFVNHNLFFNTGQLINTGIFDSYVSLQNLAGASFTSSGALHLIGETTTLQSSSFTIADGSQPTIVGGPWINSGTVDCIASITLLSQQSITNTGTFSCEGPMKNDGTLNLAAGTWNNNGPLFNGGTITIASGGTLMNNGSITTDRRSSITNGGLLINAGGLSLGAFSSASNLSGAIFTNGNTLDIGTGFTNNGTFNNSGTLHCTGMGSFSNTSAFNNSGYAAFILFNNSGTFTNSGTLSLPVGSNWQNNSPGLLTSTNYFTIAGNFINGANATVVNGTAPGAATAKTTKAFFRPLPYMYNSGTFTNNGTLNSYSTLQNTGALTNNGLLQNYGYCYLFTGGTVISTGTGINSGSILVDSAAVFTCTAGTFNNINSMINTKGTLSNTGATFTSYFGAILQGFTGNCACWSFMGQPSNTTVAVGSTARFSVAVSQQATYFIWESSPDGRKWSAVANAANPAALLSNFNTLMIPNVTLSQNGTQFRCLVIGNPNDNRAYSNYATLTVTNGAVNKVK